MSSSISHSSCRFHMTQDDILALVHLGWDGCNASMSTYTWNTEDALLPKSMMQQLSGTVTHTSNGTSHDSGTTTDHLYTVVDCHHHYNANWYYTDYCHNEVSTFGIALWFFFTGLFIFLIISCFCFPQEEKCVDNACWPCYKPSQCYKSQLYPNDHNDQNNAGIQSTIDQPAMTKVDMQLADLFHKRSSVKF